MSCALQTGKGVERGGKKQFCKMCTLTLTLSLSLSAVHCTVRSTCDTVHTPRIQTLDVRQTAVREWNTSKWNERECALILITSSRFSVISFKCFFTATPTCAQPHTRLFASLSRCGLEQTFPVFCASDPNPFWPQPSIYTSLPNFIPSLQTRIYAENCVCKSLPAHFLKMVIGMDG